MASNIEDSEEKCAGECPICNQMVGDLLRHCQTCMPTSDEEYFDSMEMPSSPQTDDTTKRESNGTNTKSCIICFKPINKDEYVAHVQSCLPQTPDDDFNMTRDRNMSDACLSCSSSVNHLDGSGILIPCPSRHVHCKRCLQKSLLGFIETQSTPVCHPMFCDYQLNIIDISLIPLEPSAVQRLIPLVRNRQRPQCPQCHFYVNVDTIADFDRHILICSLDVTAVCQYCHCPKDVMYLDDHVRQCRNEPKDRQQTLVDFVSIRTKYPFSPQQIDYFIQMRKKNKLPIDALSIVEALANFDDIFPFELPSRQCDICMESYLYDDIFVFGCPDSHKSCYNCYEASCRSKINTKEILTCGMCPYQLSYGEVQQLRVSAQEREQFVEYQIQKTFESYARSGKGIIKCPNQSCKWAFEPEDPTQRFLVTCPVCKIEFCSLCSQQYHFRIDCQELNAMTQRWYFWCDTERQRYWQKKAEQNIALEARIKEMKQQKRLFGFGNSQLRSRYQQLIIDEKYKAENCRLCPHCGRIVQHMGGCSSMFCGRDYHGGNDQSGCGKEFKWEQAKKYIPLTDKNPEEVMRDLLNPKNNLVTHSNYKCARCHEVIRGIRFECIHCPSLSYCENCEERCTHEHLNESQQKGKGQHIFQLITTL